MLTMAADPVRAECSLAAMAGAMDPHANWLLNPGHSNGDRHSPLSRLQCQSIFGKESTSFFFLDDVILFGCHGDSRFADSGGGLAFFDGLGDASGDW